MWMRIIGARMRTPATSVSKARSYSPSKCDTSVEVPPMSKPMTLAKPASFAVSTMRDHAAGRAGEDRVLALEQLGRGQPAGRLHEHQAAGRAPSSAATSST